MRVCITGGTGFLGAALVRDLLAEGRLGSGAGETFPTCRSARSSRRTGCARRFGRPRTVLPARWKAQTLSIIWQPRSILRATEADFLEANVAGTENVLTASLRQGVGRVLYASSLAVYGPVASGQRIDENTPHDESPQLRDFYAESKILADQFAVTFRARNGIADNDHQAGNRLRARLAASGGLAGIHAGQDATSYSAIATIAFR